jgi:hypothetical protein
MQPSLKKKKTSHDKKRHVLSRKRCPRKHYKKLMKDTLFGIAFQIGVR